MKKIGLLMVALLSLGQAEFSQTSNGTVKDSQTKLEWQDSYKDNTVPYLRMNKTISYCHDLKLDGEGWRLPNINELKSIVIDTQFAPSINSKFDNTKNSYYWSSSSRSGATYYKWIVNFSNGITNFQLNNSSYYSYVRCVRDAN